MITTKFNRSREAPQVHNQGSRSVHAKGVTIAMVIECHKRNPRWSATDIVRSLGCSRQLASEMLRRGGIVLRASTFGNTDRRRFERDA